MPIYRISYTIKNFLYCTERRLLDQKHFNKTGLIEKMKIEWKYWEAIHGQKEHEKPSWGEIYIIFQVP